MTQTRKPNLAPNPQHRSTQPTTNLPSYTFTQLIEADHQALNDLAGRTTHPSLPPTTRLNTLKTLIWRLIRHDISEDLVMRPAFAAYLGDPGAVAAARDRDDHAALRGRLVALFERVDRPVAEGMGNGEVVVDDNEEALISEVKGLAGEMAEHMREESGVVLPRFEREVSDAVSLRLGWEYARTLVLTPGVEGCGDGGQRERCFPGVMEYLVAEMDVFKGILRMLEEQAGREVDGGYLERRMREEMGEIGLFVGEEDKGVSKEVKGGKLKL